jgi:hypothetical protein
MASYFVARRARPDGIHPVHDRSRCPPECFPASASEYLGEFLDPAQAVMVARLRYASAGACPRCDPLLAAAAWVEHRRSLLAPLRP